MIGASYDYIFDEIPAGGTAEYTVYIDIPSDFDVASAQYVIVVKGEAAD